MMMTTKRQASVAAASAVLACGVTLSGCSSDEETPQESASSSSTSSSSASSSSSSSTPTDPDGARAIAVVKNFERTTNEIRLDPSMQSAELGAYATGQAYKQRTFDIRESRKQGERQRGGVKVLDAEASKRSATSQQVVVCTDLTEIRVTDKSGKKIDLPHDRLERIYTVDKSDGETQDGKWRVTTEKVKQTC